HEIDVIAARNPFEKWRIGLFLEPIPTHVGHLETFTGAKADDFAGKKLEALLLAELFAFGKKQLKTQTYSQKRFLTLDNIANRLDQAKFSEIFHTRVERADAGQNYTAG